MRGAVGNGDLAEFRRLLKGHRERRRWAQDRLASEAEMDHSLVSRLEGGSRAPTPETIAKLVGGLALGRGEADALWLAAGYLPPDLPLDLAGEALALARASSAVEVAAARALIVTVRYAAQAAPRIAGVASQAKR